jgi:lysophospholipase L1-like esterase
MAARLVDANMKETLTMPRVLIFLTIAICVAGLFVAFWGIQNYKSDKLATLEPPFLTRQIQAHQNVDILLFGDSRAAHWDTALLAGAGSVASAGIGGDVTPAMLKRLDHDVIANSPGLAVIAAGINDIVAGSLLKDKDRRKSNLERVILNIDEIVEQLNKADIPIVLLTISPPLQPNLLRQIVWGNGIAEDVEKVNQSIRALQSDKVKVIETMAVFRSYGGGWLDAVRLDTLHYTPVAYGLLSKEILAVMGEK